MDLTTESRKDESAFLQTDESVDMVQHGGDRNEGTHRDLSAERSQMSSHRSILDQSDRMTPIDLTSGGQIENEAPSGSADRNIGGQSICEGPGNLCAHEGPGNLSSVEGDQDDVTIIRTSGVATGTKGQGEKLILDILKPHYPK